MELGAKRLFDEITAAAENHLFYLALVASLALPDICSSMSSKDGEATKPRYIAWFDKYVAHRYTVQGTGTLTGEDCYRLRCSMLHQGSAQKPEARYRRYAFLPGRGLHNIAIGHLVLNGVDMGGLIQLSIPQFCQDIIRGAIAWLSEVENSLEFRQNYDRFLQFRPNGLPPIVGGPIIA